MRTQLRIEATAPSPYPLPKGEGFCGAALLIVLGGLLLTPARAQDDPPAEGRIVSTAYAIPKETTSEESGYFSIVEGLNRRLYIGTAKYRSNAYLVEFDLASKAMKVVVDVQKEIGTQATGFAAQSKIHTRNNVGPSGKIYFGTKQGYPAEGEKRSDYRGGYPLVFDPATGKTRVYDIPVAEQGVISVTPDEARGVAYISTTSDSRPLDSTHFLILDLASGKYRDLLDCQHMYAFIVLDHLGRAYHPIAGGEIARWDPQSDAPGAAERKRSTARCPPKVAAGRSRDASDQLGSLARPPHVVCRGDERQLAV